MLLHVMRPLAMPLHAMRPLAMRAVKVQVTLRAEGCTYSRLRRTAGKYAGIEIPGFKRLFLANLVLDYNGTLACDGKLINGAGVWGEDCSLIVFRFMS